MNNSFIFSFAAVTSGISLAGGFVLGADEKPPIHANLSRLPKPKFKDWPPPMESPAIARCSLSVNTAYFFSTKGTRSFNRSFSKLAKACTLSLSKIFPVARSSFIALPLGITTIMGCSFPSAYRLSRIICGCAPLSHSFSSPPMPCKRYSTGYLFFLEYPGGVYTKAFLLLPTVFD